ncbi:helix-turn-helix domain-containing protein [Falsirhodobacter halotolerans]|uniref:helix-turn-helix domain-containing protein n=1 Tax=Falsirhodobacter halotolerans TaxID=1146892 RepID=UPI001FD16B60|nr:helix-turn-helix domain-containing protein [Falsirhodobacter halotolerans]MCJ8140052.1 helix-turn-helix domain-containing protein [Falsirhodobacter halotolerans]
MSIRSIERAMTVLQEMNMQPYTTVRHLHARTGLPKPTIVRILQTLEHAGFVENDTRIGGYQLSALVSSLSSGYHKEPMVVEAGRPWAIAVTRKYQWPVSISLLDRDAVVVRFSTVPDSSVSPFHKTVNMRLPLLTRGMGLAYLAFTPPEECDLIVNMLRNSDDPEDRLAQSPEAVARLISVTREQGFAVRSPEAQPRNSNTIAVPIYNEHGRVVASLGLTYFISAFPSLRSACETYGPVLKDASREITKDLTRLNRTTAG